VKILLIVGHDGIYSGASYQALYLAMGLRDRGHEVHCVWGPSGGDPTLDAVKDAGLMLHTLSMRGKFNIQALRELRALLRRESFDVVHCFKGMAMYRALWASWGMKIPALIFNREVSKPLEHFQGSKYRSRRVDRVVADSEAVRRIVIQSGGVAPQKVSVVYDEVDLRRYHPDVDGTEVRREFDVAADQFFCGVVGNYAPWRGQEYFLQAAARIQQAGTDAGRMRYLIIGKETERLVPLARELGIEAVVRFTGFRRDLERVVAALDAVVNCSYEVESLSGAVTIAMAMGKPVIATAIAGTPELVEDGFTGRLVPPRDAAALAQAIRETAALAEEQRREMGIRARRKMEADFSREARARRMEELYLEIIRQKRV
jgi:glycosyltransferase involved in cell wall biosynthesis